MLARLPASLWRHVRLFGYFVRFGFTRALIFRLDFFFRIVMDCIYYAVNIAFFRVLFLHSPTLAGWTEPQAMVFVATYLLVDAIHMTIFSNNTWWLPVLINRGDLDYYLVRPVSSLYFLMLRDFAANSFVNFLFATGIFAWAIHAYPEPLGAGKVALLFALAVNGAFVYALIYTLLLIPTFWLHSPGGLRELHHALSKATERPDRIFRGWARLLFTVVLPYSLIASFPARLAIEAVDLRVALHLALGTAGLFVVVLAAWHFGLRAYSSASS